MEGQEGGVGGEGGRDNSPWHCPHGGGGGGEITVHDTVHRLQSITALCANGQTNPKLDQQAPWRLTLSQQMKCAALEMTAWQQKHRQTGNRSTDTDWQQMHRGGPATEAQMCLATEAQAWTGNRSTDRLVTEADMDWQQRHRHRLTTEAQTWNGNRSTGTAWQQKHRHRLATEAPTQTGNRHTDCLQMAWVLTVKTTQDTNTGTYKCKRMLKGCIHDVVERGLQDQTQWRVTWRAHTDNCTMMLKGTPGSNPMVINLKITYR